MNKLFLFVILFLLLPLSGCWDRVEVNDLAIVVGTGIDASSENEGNNKVKLSLLIVKPSSGGGGGKQMGGGGSGSTTDGPLVISAEGKTIADAATKLQAKVSRNIFWGHNRIVVIGEEFAQKGFRKELDFFGRHPEPRLRAYVFVSEGEASDLLETMPTLDRGVDEALRELARFKIGASITLKELMQTLSSDAKGAPLPWAEKDQKGVRINGTAVTKNGKMVGYINEELTRGILWIRDEVRFATINVSPPGSEGFVTMEQIRSRSELIPKIENEQWSITIKIETEDDIIQNETMLNMMDEQVTEMLERETEKAVKQRIEEALEIVQKEFKTDILLFGEAFEREYPKQWKEKKEQWDEIFPNVAVNIEVKGKVQRPGMSSQSPTMPEEKGETK